MTCNECFHCSVCPFADGTKYANEEFIKLDCEHFINTANVAPIADTVREMQERLTAFFENDETVKYVEVDAEYINEQINKIAKEMEENLK